MAERVPAPPYTLHDVQQTYKARDAWWTVFLVDPLASRLVKVTANRTRITPNQLTVAALILGLVCAWLFWNAATWALILGAVIYHVSFVLDCMDGKIARLKGTGSILGSWLDYIFDRIRVFVCALALFGGQYRESGRVVFLVMAAVVVFCDALRYMDAMQIDKVVRSMRQRILDTCEANGVDPARYLGFGGSALADGADAENTTVESAAADRAKLVDPDALVTKAAGAQPVQTRAQEELSTSFRSRFGWFMAVRDFLRRHRVRPHLFSGIEFQMFVFIVAPITTLVLPVTVLSVVLLLVFELAIIYKLVLSTRDFEKLLVTLRASSSDV